MANGHGGRRSGAGRPRKPLAEKVLDGTAKKPKEPKILEFHTEMDYVCPDVPAYLARYGSKYNGEPCTTDVFRETVAELEKTGCLDKIHPSFIVDYVILRSEWLGGQRMLNTYGPVTASKSRGDDREKGQILIESPFVDVTLKFYKAAQVAWEKIDDVIRRNSGNNWSASPRDAMMAGLLRLNRED